MLGIKSDTLRSEIDQILERIQSIKESADNGVPGDDIPANESNQEIYQVHMRGEMLLIAQRLLALAESIKDD